MRRRPSVSEGFLITLVGIIGIIRVLDILPEAGPMGTRMLYTELFLFVAIGIIGIKTMKDARK